MFLSSVLLIVLAAGCADSYDEATRALQSNKLDRARAALANTGPECRLSTSYLSLTGVVSELSGDTAAAEAAFEKALTLEPASIRLHEQLGAAYLRNHKPEPAAKQLQEVLRLDPHNTSAPAYLAGAYVEQQDWPAASRLFRDFPSLQRNSAQPVVLLWFAQALIHTGELDRLARELPAPSSALPSPLLFSLGTLLAQNHLYAESIKYLQAIPEKNVDDSVYFNLGLAFSHLQRFPDARRNYFRAIDLQPHHADAYFRIGVDFAESGEPRKAIPWLLRAHQWLPGRDDITYSLAEQLIQLRYFHTAAQILPAGSRLLVAQADLALAQGDPSKAIVQYQRALQNKSEPPIPALLGLARAFTTTGQLDQAANRLNQALSLDKNNAAALAEAGRLAAKQQQWRNAATFFQSSWQRDKSDPAIALELARSLRHIGELQAALTTLNTITNDLHQSPAYHAEKAQLYAQLQNQPQALAERAITAQLQSQEHQQLHFDNPADYVY